MQIVNMWTCGDSAGKPHKIALKLPLCGFSMSCFLNSEGFGLIYSFIWIADPREYTADEKTKRHYFGSSC